tara:strand:+ start:7283 stop:7438 length:156 start_codon:yes stop_codon:yes gene_type:complete
MESLRLYFQNIGIVVWRVEQWGAIPNDLAAIPLLGGEESGGERSSRVISRK